MDRNPIAKKVTFDPDTMWVEFADGRTLGGTGLHWEEIDEDICVRALMQGFGDRTTPQS